MTNNIITKNSASSNGAGIYIDYFSTPLIINNTIVRNDSGPPWARQGIYMFSMPSPTIMNNIIALQGRGIQGSTGVADYNNVWGNDSDYGSSPRGPNDLSCDPLFVTGDSLYHIQPDSPVIDKGTSEHVPSIDFDGNLRPIGGSFDIGADEDTTLVTPAPLSPSLVFPSSGRIDISTDPLLSWSGCTRADSYRVQIATNQNFLPAIRDTSGITKTEHQVNELDELTTYYWRVKGSNKGGTSEWSDTWHFTTRVTTSASERNNQTPSEFILSQNYPNPFNPTTTIEYTLSHAVFVNLAVFNLLGEKIEVIVNEFQEAGKHRVNWKPSNLQSGVYLYRLQANNFLATRKLILLQ